MRPDGEITRGTTSPSRLRRVDRWVTGALPGVLRAGARPLIADLGFGASPVTTLELYRAVRAVAPEAEVTVLEIDPARVAAASGQLAALRAAGRELPGLSFGLGGFELPLPRPPALVRAFNVLRQYREDQVEAACARMRAGLAGGGVLVEGTCDEIGRRAVWVTLPAAGGGALVTFSARVASLGRPSDLAERLPKALIHRNVPGQPVHEFLRAFDAAWSAAAPASRWTRSSRCSAPAVRPPRRWSRSRPSR